MSGRGKPIRVLLVGPSAAKAGGQATQARRLLEYFGTVPELQPQFLPINPVLPRPFHLLQRLPMIRTVVTEITYLVTLLLRVPRIDVVHAFSASYLSFLLAPTPAILVARLLGKRVVLNYRSGEADDHLARWGWHAKPIIRLAHATVAPSGYLVEVFRRHGLRAEAIENFVDLERIRYRPRQAPAPRFLSNRSFEPLYNVSCVLRAFARIQAIHPGASLVLAGEGSQRRRLEHEVGEMGLQRVTFAGVLSPADMADAYDEADIYLNSPNIDNMPNSVVEALAAGLPVVSTDAGGIPWILSHEVEGLLVPVNDDGALAEAALRLLREPGLGERLGRTGRQRVEREFTWQAVRERWLALYRRLAAT